MIVISRRFADSKIVKFVLNFVFKAFIQQTIKLLQTLLALLVTR